MIKLALCGEEKELTLTAYTRKLKLLARQKRLVALIVGAEELQQQVTKSRVN